MFKEKIQPSLVLTLICLITCALLVIAYEATYVDNTGVITDEMITGLEEIYGTSDGFEMKLDENGNIYSPEGVTCVLADGNGRFAYEITTDGYSSGGLHVLVGMENGSVSSVSILSIGETPGLGTKVQDSSFLDQFKGLSADMLPKEEEADSSSKKLVWGSKEEIESLKAEKEAASAELDSVFQLDAVTGATFSSNGMYRAVEIALDAYNMEGVTVSE